MPKQYAFRGGRWRDSGGRFASARQVARFTEAPLRTVRVSEREPRHYVRVTVNERVRIPERGHGVDRMVEVHVSRVLKDPSAADERRARREARAEVARLVAEKSKREGLGAAVSRVVGVEVEVVRRHGRTIAKVEVRDAKTGERATKEYVR